MYMLVGGTSTFNVYFGGGDVILRYPLKMYIFHWGTSKSTSISSLYTLKFAGPLAQGVIDQFLFFDLLVCVNL